MRLLASICLLLLLGNSTVTRAQSGTFQLKGKIIDGNNKPVSFATVVIDETKNGVTADENGVFTLPLNARKGDRLNLLFSRIGMQTAKDSIIVGDLLNQLVVFRMYELNLSLKEIKVSPESGKSISNSAIVIDRDVIEQTPALSISDLLNLLPNQKFTPPSLQNVQNLNLRIAPTATNTGRSDFGLNNAFGIAIIMDGNLISNNANMQSRNPLRSATGLSGAVVTTGGSVGVGNTDSYSGDNTFGGIDLRQIPTENISKIEVISGVASAKYGEMTDGAVIIERQAGYSPLYIRTQLRDNASNYGFSKGFHLKNNLGALNIGANYTSSFMDNRDKLKAYKRLTTNLMWTKYFGKDEKVKNTFSLDYSKFLDGVKKDPDEELDKTARFDSWNFAVANRLLFNVNKNFMKSASLNMRLSYGEQVTSTEEYVNKPVTLYTLETSPGIHEGNFGPGQYTSLSMIEGKPINYTASLDFNTEFYTGNLKHRFTYGGNFNYSANKGRGQLFDPALPRAQANVNFNSKAGLSERYYDYSLIYPQKDGGVYLEDRFITYILGKPLSSSIGLRLDLQNKYKVLNPRSNFRYKLSGNFDLGLALGFSSKAPGLGQLYPGPVFFDIPLIIHFTGNESTSTYLLYTDRYDQEPKDIKPMKSFTTELNLSYHKNGYNFTLNAFYKNSTNGFGTETRYKFLHLPKYNVEEQAGTKPNLTPTGEYLNTQVSYYSLENNLASKNTGLELMMAFPKFDAIATTLNAALGITRSELTKEGLKSTSYTNDQPENLDYATVGVYENGRTINVQSRGRLSTNTHFPKLRLMIRFTGTFDLIDKNSTPGYSGVPIAYYTADGRYFEVKNFDPADPDMMHLLRTDNVKSSNSDQPAIYSNFHANISKDILKNITLSFNVYNFFNYRPRFRIEGSTDARIPNGRPTFGAELVWKIP